MRILIYPHALYRNRYIDDYCFSDIVFDETDKYSLTSFSFTGVRRLLMFLKNNDKSCCVEIHTSMGAPIPLFVSLLLGYKKRVYVCHGSLLYSRSRIHSFAGYFIELFNVVLSSKVILVSESLKKRFPLSKGLAFSQPGIFSYKNFPMKPFVNIDNKIRVGYVGRDVSRKGINKFSRIAVDNVDDRITFHAFGVKRSIKSVNVYGFVKEKKTLFDKFDVLYVCSDFEGYCDAAAEAIMYGKYVFHDDVPGLEWLPDKSILLNCDLNYENIYNAIGKLRRDFIALQSDIKEKDISKCKSIINK